MTAAAFAGAVPFTSDRTPASTTAPSRTTAGPSAGTSAGHHSGGQCAGSRKGATDRLADAQTLAADLALVDSHRSRWSRFMLVALFPGQTVALSVRADASDGSLTRD